jgi:hypothetical protein
MSDFYIVFFEGDTLSAFSDWFSGRKTINKCGPYANKNDAITASKAYTRACIVYHATNQVCLHSQEGFVQQAIPDLMTWAKANISVPAELVRNDGMIEKENEKQQWAFSKIKHISHKVEFTEYKLAVGNLAKLMTATVAGMVGNIPGILDAVSDLTIDICSGEDSKKEDDAWIKDITDKAGHKGILVMKALTETTLKKKFFGKNEKNLSMTGLVCILVPLSEAAKLECANIKNKHASTVLTQIEKEFNFDTKE